jgi:hypothetical protein
MDVYMNATPSDLRLCRAIWKRMLPLNANSLSERKGDLRSRKIARFGLVIPLFIVLNISLLQDYSVAANKTNHYRQYAFIQLNNLDQFYCLDELNFKESRWNPKAKNGSHHGIPQGRSKWLATVDGFKQIDWQLKYIKKRYDNPCNALQHHKIKGWY